MLLSFSYPSRLILWHILSTLISKFILNPTNSLLRYCHIYSSIFPGLDNWSNLLAGLSLTLGPQAFSQHSGQSGSVKIQVSTHLETHIDTEAL